MPYTHPFLSQNVSRRALLMGAGITSAAALYPWSGPLAQSVSRTPLPKMSDIVLSPRFPRNETLPVIQSLRPTRLEWHYLSNTSFWAQMAATAPMAPRSATINANPALPAGSDGLARDIENKEIIAPWMTSWGAKMATVASATTRNVLLSTATDLVNRGAGAIHVDDIHFQFATEHWGAGDFSAASLAGFGPWLASNIPSTTLARLGITDTSSFNFRTYLNDRHNIKTNADYTKHRASLEICDYWRRYLLQNVIRFWDDLRRTLQNMPNKPMLSGNFGEFEPRESNIALAARMDYTNTEISVDKSPSHYHLWGAVAEAMNLPFLGAFQGATTVKKYRQIMAVSYANRINPIFPWDVFVDPRTNPNVQRYFGQVSDFSDIYEMIRRTPALVDQYQRGAVVGVVIPIDRHNYNETHRVIERLVRFNVPFRVILTGGDLHAMPIPRLADLRKLHRLILPNATDHYKRDVINALNTSGVPMTQSTALTDSQLTAHTIGQLPDTNWTMTVRHVPGNPMGSLIYLSPNTYSAGALRGTIRLQPNTMFRFESYKSFRLHRPGKPVIQIPISRVAGGTINLLIPDVDEMGILVTSMR